MRCMKVRAASPTHLMNYSDLRKVRGGNRCGIDRRSNYRNNLRESQRFGSGLEGLRDGVNGEGERGLHKDEDGRRTMVTWRKWAPLVGDSKERKSSRWCLGRSI